MNPNRKNLPIGIQTFSNIIREGHCYVDKTAFISSLSLTGKYYFLARPRRFGKSTLISTLKSAFAGEEALFKGLYLEKNWDWSVKYPVIHISFGGGFINSREDLDRILRSILNKHAQNNDIRFNTSLVSLQFRELIIALSQKHKLPVVVLIDECDKPILDNITGKETASAICEGLKDFYSVIKDSDQYIKFAFLTGVSKFNKGSLFSGLNNIEDISLTPSTATLCGYTEDEIKTVFADYLEDVDLDKLRRWYSGYNFLGEKVYNPDAVLLYLDSKIFRNYWFETGSPRFLLDLIEKNHYPAPNIEKLTADTQLLDSFDVDHITLEALLFQTGYLTIKDQQQLGDEIYYTLGYPNLEVKMSLTRHILTHLTQDMAKSAHLRAQAYLAMSAGKVEELNGLLSSLFASIPHDWYRKNLIAKHEGYYASIVYCYFAAMGLDVIPEDSTNLGQIDLTVKIEGYVYIFEFKVVDGPTKENTALAQIKDKKYFEKYVADMQVGKRIFLMGIEFDKEARNIVQFDWESPTE